MPITIPDDVQDRIDLANDLEGRRALASIMDSNGSLRFKIQVTIGGYRKQFHRHEFLVAPVAGEGEFHVTADNLDLMEDAKTDN